MGKTIYILSGPYGAGKTTLLNNLCGKRRIQDRVISRQEFIDEIQELGLQWSTVLELLHTHVDPKFQLPDNITVPTVWGYPEPADFLKMFVCSLWNLDHKIVYGEDDEFRKFRDSLMVYIPVLDKNLTIRELLIYFGTEIFRNHYGQDIWANLLVSRFTVGWDIYVGGVRFTNEWQMIRKWAEQHGYHVKHINILRNLTDIIGADRCTAEWGFLDIPSDWVLLNNGSVQDLLDKFRMIFGG